MTNFFSRSVIMAFWCLAFPIMLGLFGCYYDRLVASSKTQAPLDGGADGETDTDTDSDTDLAECPPLPEHASPSPPQESDSCEGMDWSMSPDAFYLISWFGTSADTEAGSGDTYCGQLQDHYNNYGCVYDNHIESCLESDYLIPNIQGRVDYIYEDVESAVAQYSPGDVPVPEYFYIADGQRFNCGSILRVSNFQNNRCIVVYVEDGGPSYLYETASYGNRRILNASPAVHLFLDIVNTGWANSDLVYVEWGTPDDIPGHTCIPCQSTPAKTGSEDQKNIYDPNHMLVGVDCSLN
jgi:hypothetical protein